MTLSNFFVSADFIEMFGYFISFYTIGYIAGFKFLMFRKGMEVVS